MVEVTFGLAWPSILATASTEASDEIARLGRIVPQVVDYEVALGPLWSPESNPDLSPA